MSDPKPTFKTIDQYIESFPDQIRPVLQSLRETIVDAAPEAKEAIKYGMPTFVFHGNLVYFGAWKKHVALYPITAAMEESLDELKQFKTSGKGTVQFPYDKPLPLALVRQIVEFRVKDNLDSLARRAAATADEE